MARSGEEEEIQLIRTGFYAVIYTVRHYLLLLKSKLMNTSPSGFKNQKIPLTFNQFSAILFSKCTGISAGPAFFAFTLLVIFLPLRQIRSAEFPKSYDAEGQVNFLVQFLTKFSDRYALLLTDGFEKEFLYYPRNNSTDLADIRYIFRTPENKAFENEKSIVLKYAETNATFERSLFIHTSFNIPGQNFHIIPHKPIALKGQLYRASIWIHSNNSNNSFSLLFKNASGKDVEVNLGRLNWNGWKRLDKELPKSLYRRGKNFATRYRHTFTGFLIRSPTGRDTENASLMIDNFLIVSDIKEISYPGSEILDNWK